MIELTSGQIIEKIRKDIDDTESKGFKILIEMTVEFKRYCDGKQQSMITPELMDDACEIVKKYQNSVETLNTVTNLMKSISDSQTTHIR